MNSYSTELEMVTVSIAVMILDQHLIWTKLYQANYYSVVITDPGYISLEAEESTENYPVVLLVH